MKLGKTTKTPKRTWRQKSYRCTNSRYDGCRRQDLIFRLVVRKTKKQLFEFRARFSNSQVYLYIYMEILIFDSIPKVRKVCMCTSNRDLLSLRNTILIILKFQIFFRKKITVLRYEHVTYKYIYIYMCIHIYYLSNFRYTFEHHSILIFESIAKVEQVCICIWNIHIHASLTFGILSKWLPYKI